MGALKDARWSFVRVSMNRRLKGERGIASFTEGTESEKGPCDAQFTRPDRTVLVGELRG